VVGSHRQALLDGRAFQRAPRGEYEQALDWYQQRNEYAQAAGDAFWSARIANCTGAVSLEVYDLWSFQPLKTMRISTNEFQKWIPGRKICWGALPGLPNRLPNRLLDGRPYGNYEADVQPTQASEPKRTWKRASAYRAIGFVPLTEPRENDLERAMVSKRHGRRCTLNYHFL